MTPFSALLAAIAADGEGFSVTTSDDWRQGRTLYGGIAAALCLEATQRAFATLPPLRSAQISFVGPAAGAVHLKPTLPRQGKSATFVGCDLVAEGQVGTRAVFCFGAARPSAFDRKAPVMPADLPGPDEVQDYFPDGIGPAFRVHFDMKLARGGRPMSGAAEPDVWLWGRHRDAAAPDDAVALLALADAPPPAAMSLFTAPGMISSMTWMIDVLDPTALSAPGWKLMRAHAETVVDGYSAQAMTMWGEDGRALAAGRQTIAVFV